jgi:hypothetical protein
MLAVESPTMEQFTRRSTNELILCPPPAPRKVHVRKTIEVSSRVRRRLNFDDMDDFLATPKRIRLAPSVELFAEEDEPSSPTGVSSLDGSFFDDHTTTPLTTTTTTTLEETTSRTTRNLNKLTLKLEEERSVNENVLQVDDGGFTTPDKCVCKPPKQTSEYISKFKVKPGFKRRALRL